ncbi:MAG: hypothetical protein HY017_24955 [Betaproteobacteria bacterium]|nr:hypothetical protein [Betaproteobacteria bacterium]
MYLLVDRIHINVGVGSKALHGFVVTQLKGMKDIQGDVVPDGKITITENKYRTRLNYYPTKKRKIAELEVGAKAHHRYFKLVLYASKFGPGEFEQLKWVLSELLPDFNYPKLFETGRVSYVELAADSLTHIAHSFVPFRAKANNSWVHDDGNGVKGSTYLGSKLSALRFCIYDKHKQQVENHLPVTDPLRTRVESRSRHIGLPPCELPKMVNPFLKLEVADLQKARDASEDHTWQEFLDLCFVLGSARALAQQTKYKRTQFMKMLRASAAPWWNPQYVWKDLPRAIAAIAP